jgi:hypothetical protein
VTNGYLRDTQDRDFMKKEKRIMADREGGGSAADLASICHSVQDPQPAVPQPGQGRRPL